MASESSMKSPQSMSTFLPTAPTPPFSLREADAMKCDKVHLGTPGGTTGQTELVDAPT